MNQGCLQSLPVNCVKSLSKVQFNNKSRNFPQAVRILHKRGDEVVVIKEEDTTRELKRLESTLSTVVKQIKVSIALSMFVFDVGDWSSS